MKLMFQNKLSLKFIFIVLGIVNLSINNSFAQDNQSIYLRDGSGFDAMEAFDFSNDSVSLKLSNKECVRIAVIEMNKMKIVHGKKNFESVFLKDGTKLKAEYAFNFQKNLVTLKIEEDSFMRINCNDILKMNLISVLDTTTQNVEKLKFSYGVNQFFTKQTKSKLNYATELSCELEIKNQYYFGVQLGYLGDNNNIDDAANFKRIISADVFGVSQYLNTIESSNFKSVENSGSIAKNLFYVGVKGGAFLFGKRVRNYFSVGANYFFKTESMQTKVVTNSIETNRNVPYFDTITGKNANLTEPLIITANYQSKLTRKPFASVNVSYGIKFRLYKSIQLKAEVGFSLSTLNFYGESNYEYDIKYLTTNSYNTPNHTSTKRSGKGDDYFNQYYLSIGLQYQHHK